MILCSGDIKGPDPDCAECDGTGVDFAETNDTGTILHPCPYCRKKDKENTRWIKSSNSSNVE